MMQFTFTQIHYTLYVVVVAVVLVTGTVVVGCLLMKERRKTGDAGAQENGGQHVDTSRDIQVYLNHLMRLQM